MRDVRHTIRMATLVAVVMSAMAGQLFMWPGAALGNTHAAEGQAASPAAIARHILGHVPRGLARTIARRGTVRVANDLNYPPQSYIDPVTSRLVGFDVDVAKKAARILGLRVVWRHPAWANVINGLRHGRFDVSIGSMAVTPERKELVAFTGPYRFEEGQVFVKTGGTQITGPDDLAGKTVGVVDGTSYGDYLAQNTTATVVTYGAIDDAVADLAGGTLDFWMTDPVSGQQIILASQPIEFSGKPLCYTNLAFALKKGERDWRMLLNYAVKKMHDNGALTTMSQKWYSGLDLTVRQ